MYPTYTVVGGQKVLKTTKNLTTEKCQNILQRIGWSFCFKLQTIFFMYFNFRIVIHRQILRFCKLKVFTATLSSQNETLQKNHSLSSGFCFLQKIILFRFASHLLNVEQWQTLKDAFSYFVYKYSQDNFG